MEVKARKDDIHTYRKLLNIHRNNLSTFRSQAAQFGIAVPINIIHEIDRNCSEISELKNKLRDLGEEVEDLPSDNCDNNYISKENLVNRKTKELPIKGISPLRKWKSLFIFTTIICLGIIGFFIVNQDRATARITKPIDGDIIPQSNKVIGTYENIDDNINLWIYIFIPELKRYHLARINDRTFGSWSVDIFVGQENESGDHYKLGIISMNNEDSKMVDQRNAEDLGSFLIELPSSAKVYHQINVFRKP